MAIPSDDASPDGGLHDLLGDLASRGAHGWTIDAVDWSDLADLHLSREDSELQVWIAPAEPRVPSFRRTRCFQVGYRGSDVPPGGMPLLEEIVRRLEAREARLAPGEAFVWPRLPAPPAGRLVVDDGNLELRITGRCNERCPFCNSTDRVDNRMDGPADVEAALREASLRGVRTVHFTGGEPTLDPALPGWVAIAKRSGLDVMIQTNALTLGDDAFWEAFRGPSGTPLLPDRLFVSFHTARADRVKILTGVGGTFRRKVAGIRKALDRGVGVILNVVVQRANLDELPDLPRFVAATFGTSPMLSLSVIAPTGASSRRPDLWPDMDELVTALGAALEASEALGINASVPEVCGVPLCTMPGHRRFFEAWHDRRPGSVKRLSEDRVKTPACPSCAWNDRCIGIWRRYAEERGTGGFRPINALPPQEFPGER